MRSVAVPEGYVRFSYRQLTNGEPSKFVLQNVLECSDAQCTLTTLALGQCIFGAYYPKIERITTSDGLAVEAISADAVTAEYDIGGAKISFRMTFAEDPRISRMLSRPLLSFSGGAVKQSASLDVITWDLVPVRQEDSMVEFDCPAQVDFLSEPLE